MIKKILPAIAIIILLLLIKGRIDTISRLKNTGATKAQIEDALKKEKQTNLYLNEQLKYVKTNDFIENEAREKLNLTKKGEMLVLSSTSTDNKPQPTAETKETVIWKKWVSLLF